MSALLLEAYDHLRTEQERYCRKLETSLNDHPDGRRTQEAIKGDWRAFTEEWDDLVAAARARFGAENVELVFAHLKINYHDPAEWGKPLWKPGDPGPSPFGCD